MRTGFYPKLAWEGIRKNKRLYFPYILTGCVMVMMFYILGFLVESPALAHMKGGSILMTVLPLGSITIAVFSVLFLFYTNSFLIKQRYREFGLYNILGMDKKNICRIMLWESIYVAIAAIGIGFAAGIAFSKAAELVLLNLLGMNVTYSFSVGMDTLWITFVVYGVIYLILLVNSLIKVARSKPLELMQSSKVGEKVLKRTWVFALLGLICLAFAYYVAVSIKEPLAALNWFFGAVLLVIIGTYLLFIAGSVVFCKLLQKNKKYYYKPNHFVSVASMVYRMKRNGAGLASICILLTMVLVMISSTTSLYFGEEDALRIRCPKGVNVTVTYQDIDGIGDRNLEILRDKFSQYSVAESDLTGIRACEIPGLINEEGIIINMNNAADFTALSYNQVGYLSVVSLDDYNNMMGTEKTLADDECFIYCDRMEMQWDTFTMEYGNAYKVKERLEDFQVDGESAAILFPTVHLVVKDLEKFAAPVKDMKNSMGNSMMSYCWRCNFDAETAEAEKAAAASVREILQNSISEGHFDGLTISVQSRELQRESFYDMYGSLFFLGVMLSIVFLMAAVLIIYYKQICEGYEDYARFEIMQKIGMTKRDIKKSINSQMLTVFFLPLLFAGIHLAFAFPMIVKMLQMFAFKNVLLSALVNVACFAVFGGFYALVYKITSGSYYAVVSGGKRN